MSRTAGQRSPQELRERTRCRVGLEETSSHVGLDSEKSGKASWKRVAISVPFWI